VSSQPGGRAGESRSDEVGRRAVAATPDGEQTNSVTTRGSERGEWTKYGTFGTLE
jgi:hypothetical protein